MNIFLSLREANATKQSSWIATPDYVGLAMTEKMLIVP
jgi:hypothetical protein